MLRGGRAGFNGGGRTVLTRLPEKDSEDGDERNGSDGSADLQIRAAGGRNSSVRGVRRLCDCAYRRCAAGWR